LGTTVPKEFSCSDFQAALGQGVDRHLLGLKLAALESGMQVHPLYKDPSYVRSTHFKITSSQVKFSYY
jgi:carnitine O-acetyltransferase